MKHSFIYILASSTILLSSCGLWGNYHRDDAKVEQLTQQLYRDPVKADAALEVTDTASFGNMPWREVFTDPQLQTLIDKALLQNYDLRKLDNVLQTANIALRLSKLAYLPQIALSPSGTVSKLFMDGASSSETYSVPLQASWQIDAFGTMRNSMKQAEEQVYQTKVGRQAAQTGIICGMANLYYALQMLDEQKATTESSLEIWKKQIEVMEAFKEVGYTNSAAIASAKAQVLNIESSLVTIEGKQRELENNICALMGETPHAIQRGAFTAEGFPASFSTGMPISLLANRPDVAIAESKLAYATYGVMKARGQMCPQLSISASGQFTNSAGGMILDPGRFIAAGVGNMVQPIFARGQLVGNLKISKIERENAMLDFEKSLITAGQEVSDALAGYNASLQLISNAEKQVEQLQKAYDDTEFLFHNGNTTTYLEILSARSNLLQGKLGLINNRYNKVIYAIQLYQALGGGRN